MNVDHSLGRHTPDHVAGDAEEFPGVIGRQRRYRELSGPGVGHEAIIGDDRQSVLSVTRRHHDHRSSPVYTIQPVVKPVVKPV